MKLLIPKFWLVLSLMIASAFQLSAERQRIIVLTDGEIDDRCSMVHLLLCSSDVDIADFSTIRFVAPQVETPQTLHIVCEVTDNNKMGLTGYGRIVLNILP